MDDLFDKLAEASEKLDELSKPLLGRYIKAAAGSGINNAMAYAQKSADVNTTAKDRGASLRKAVNRSHGTAKAVDKLVKEDEEVELTMEESAAQLDEISKGTLRSYIGKASDSVGGRGRKSTKKIQRGNHIEVAKEKLSKIINKEYEKSAALHKTKVTAVHDHFQKEAPKILASHGFEKVHSANDRTNYHKGHENGHSTIVSIHNKPNGGDDDHDGAYGSKFHIHSTNGSGTHMGHNHHVTHAGSLDDHKIRVVHGFHDSLIRSLDSVKNERNY